MDRNYEEEAVNGGWVPEVEWKGDPGKWREAKDFVERGEKIIPILKDRVNKLEADLEMTIKINKEAEKRGFRSAKKEYEKELKVLKDKQVEAVESGDVDEYKKVEEKITNLEEPEEPKSNPVFEDWNKQNKWYGTDKEMTEYAEFIGGRIEKGDLQDDDTLKDFYSEIKEKVQKTFPNKFKNNKRDEPDLVGSGNPAPSKGGNKTFTDLPDDAKSAFNRLKKQFKTKGHDLKKDDYVKTYFEEE